MLEELDLDKSYGATQQFKDFIDRLRKIEALTMATIHNRLPVKSGKYMKSDKESERNDGFITLKD